MHTTSELEALKQRSAGMERAARNHHWDELTRELWVPRAPRDSYLSMTQRGARQLMLGGLRVAPLSPILSFVQQFGDADQVCHPAPSRAMLRPMPCQCRPASAAQLTSASPRDRP